ncbi:hypothetical protein KJ652_04095 [Patescibacteria group bacterium]|nr:hypothetical protein [Patescibacteria group bacterium]MBU1123747.1 hypothetical protein [Patescibacteria group bacterium]
MREFLDLRETAESYAEGQVLSTSNKVKESITYSGNAVEDAKNRKFLQEISEGQWIYLGEAAHCVKTFQDLLRKYVADELDYQEWIFPRLQRTESIRNFGWEARENLRGELMRVVPNMMERGAHLPEFYLDPLQCPSFYRYMSLNSPISSQESPYKVFEVLGGWTYRNEQPERIKNGFQTGLEFIGAEMVFMGKPEDALEIRKNSLNQVIKMLDDLGIVWRTVVGSSCCHSDSAKYGNILQQGCKPDEIPTIDIECYIPHTGEWIEIGGGDLAFDRLTSKFGITFNDSDDEVWSGCQGFGFGRALYVFLSQYGCERVHWPDEFTH